MVEIIHLDETIKIKGKKFIIELNKYTKTLSISCLTTGYHIDGIIPAINLFLDNQIVSLLPDTEKESPVTLSTFSDNIGNGNRISIEFEFRNNSIIKDISLKGQFSIVLYDNKDFFIFQLIIPDEISKQHSWPLHSLAPIRITSGILSLNAKDETEPKNIMFFEHGYQSWSYSKTHSFEDSYEPLEIDVHARIYQNTDNYITGNYISESVTAISDAESKGTVIIGFCTLANSFSRIVMNHLESNSRISWLSAYSQFDNIPINQLKSQPICSEELFISFRNDGQGYLGLIEYAKITGKKMKASVDKPLTGWCSWYYYYQDISNDKLISNVDYFGESTVPLDLIQLDDGYQNAIGDFTSFNKKFPNGLSEFIEKVHNQGKLAGIWIAPFFAAENSTLYKENLPWFLRSKSENTIIPVCFNWQQFEYALDLTQPEVQDHIRSLIQTIIAKWHIDFIKIDFIYSAAIADANFANPFLTRAQVYRLGLHLIRKTIGNKTYLLGCGGPIGPSIGLVDAMRVSEDTKERWESDYEPTWGDPSLKAALLNIIYRSFMNNNFWINDPDCVIVRKQNSELTEEEIKLQLTIFGLSGGQILISEDMNKLDKERWKLALKIIPPFNETAIPIDALYESLPTLFLLETERVLGNRSLLAIINWEDDYITRNLTLKEVLMKKTSHKQFFVFDWWEEKLLGLFSLEESLPLLKIPPHGCKYLSIVPVQDNKLPLIISSTIHVSQGNFEIIEVVHNRNYLKIVIDLPGEHNGNLFILTPANTEIITDNNTYSSQKTKWGTLYKIAIRFIDEQFLKLSLKTL